MVYRSSVVTIVHRSGPYNLFLRVIVYLLWGFFFVLLLRLTLPATVFIFFAVVRLIIPRVRLWIVLAAVLPLGCGGIGKISSITFLSLDVVQGVIGFNI